MKALSIDARRNWKMGNTCDLRPLGVSHISGRIERFLQDCRKGAPCRGSHRRKRAPDIWTDTLQRFFTVSLSIHFLFLLGQWLWTSWIPSWVRLLLTQCQMFFVSVNNITIYIRKMMKRKVWIRRGRYKKRNYNFMNGRKRVFEIFSECWSSWMRETSPTGSLTIEFFFSPSSLAGQSVKSVSSIDKNADLLIHLVAHSKLVRRKIQVFPPISGQPSDLHFGCFGLGARSGG